MVQQPSYWKVLTRRKILKTDGHEGETKLNRVLGLYDLTALGVGSTLGAGVYVLAGQIAKEQAGPSVMISFAIAALASLLAGICYAEFGARVPKAGSAYIYSYVCIGEFAAFVIGWNLMLEYIIGTASVCRGISLYLDTLINDTLKSTFAEIAPMHISFLASYFDFFAFGLVVIFGVALAFGVETSTRANNFCTCLNIFVLAFVIIMGSIKADFSNWTVDVNAVNSTDVNLGNGGYFPFGFEGTLKGAATCFFGFVGFDCIATTGEEVCNPRKNIPRSILLSLLVIFLCYFGVSTVLTLMVPYYLQDPNAPLPYAFQQVGWDFAMWIVAIGGLIGLVASLCGALFPLPRVMYSMASDGLLFRFLGKVNTRFQVPVNGSIFAAIFTALIAGLFDLAQLVNLLSIGTLLAYSVVAISVTILRYMDNSENSIRGNSNETITESTMLTSSGTRITCGTILTQLFNCKRTQIPNELSTRIVGTLITVFCLLSLGIGLIFMQAHDALIHGQSWVLVLLVIFILLTALVLLAICLQPRETYTSIFTVPFVPVVPAISIFINIYLMLQLDVMTWIRFGVWMGIGVPMFIACWCMYDIKNPKNRNPHRIEFERALKASLNNKGDIMQNHTNGQLNGSRSNGKTPAVTLITKNEHSMKSLDEIMNMNEVSDELIEMKHPNGKIFYIEDTKSNTSHVSVEESKNSGGPITIDDEKFAIAMLDDVLLHAEDDGGDVLTSITTPNGQHVVLPFHDYSNRKYSIDSEMLPSVIETTTVATVHSSSDSSEHDLPVLPENGEIEQPLNGNILLRPNHLSDRYDECKMIAEKLLDDIFQSGKLWQAIEERRRSSVNSNLQQNPHDILDQSLKSDNDVDKQSIRSSRSTERDALHSDDFKNRLNELLTKKEEPTALKNQPNDEKLVLKHSKSETDLRKLLSPNKENVENNANNITNSDSNTSSGTTSNTPAEKVDIPKAPKFDPILYKTINSPYTTHKIRPKLHRTITETNTATAINDHDSGAIVRDQQNKDSEIPFKMKLEAILKHGPLQRIQKQSNYRNIENDNHSDDNDVRLRSIRQRPRSVGPSLAAHQHNGGMEPSNKSKRLIAAKSENNIYNAQDLINVRKSLKHVENGAIQL